MRVSVEATSIDVLTAFHWAGELIGQEFDAKTARQERQVRREPMLANNFRENFPLDYLFASAREQHKTTGRLPFGLDYDLLYSFLVSAHRIFGELPDAAQTEFKSKMRGFITGNFGIRPFAYELTIAMHLMQKGWDVVFADMQKVGTFDFLATKGSDAIEVECKTTSGDTGRQIHRYEINRLSALIVPLIKGLADTAGSHFLKVTIPAKLES